MTTRVMAVAVLGLGLLGCVDLFETPSERDPLAVDAGVIDVDGAPPDTGEAPIDSETADAACAPTAERCDGLDDDCDGRIDEEIAEIGAPCPVGVGICRRSGAWACDAGEDGVMLRCVGDAGPPGEEACNGLDDDCDGATDEDHAGRCCHADDPTPPCNGCPTGSLRPPDGWVCIPAGEFMMGTPDDEAGRPFDEMPRHPVQISEPFWMMQTEVTRGDWEAIFRNDPAYFRRQSPTCVGADEWLCPVEQISWLDALAYAIRRSDADGLGGCYRADVIALCDGVAGSGCPAGERQCAGDLTCRGTQRTELAEAPLRCAGYRLPTEAEWEYAHRAGSAASYWPGDHVNALTAAGWYQRNSGDTPQRVGIAPSPEPPPGPEPPAVPDAPLHPWGLFDTHGNVAEWVHDGYREYPADDEVDIDPRGSDINAERVLRGGSWASSADEARSAARFADWADARSNEYGFRLVRPVIPVVPSPPK